MIQVFNEKRSIVFTSARLREYYNPTRSHNFKISIKRPYRKQKRNILANSLRVTCKNEMKILFGLVIMPSKKGLLCTKDISGTKYGPKGEHLQMIALIKNFPFRWGCWGGAWWGKWRQQPFFTQRLSLSGDLAGAHQRLGSILWMDHNSASSRLHAHIGPRYPH